MIQANLKPNKKDEVLIAIAEEIKEGLTELQCRRYLAALLDGKKFNTLPKYISSKSKSQAESYQVEDMIFILATNWNKFQ